MLACIIFGSRQPPVKYWAGKAALLCNRMRFKGDSDVEYEAGHSSQGTGGKDTGGKDTGGKDTGDKDAGGQRYVLKCEKYNEDVDTTKFQYQFDKMLGLATTLGIVIFKKSRSDLLSKLLR